MKNTYKKAVLRQVVEFDLHIAKKIIDFTKYQEKHEKIKDFYNYLQQSKIKFELSMNFCGLLYIMKIFFNEEKYNYLYTYIICINSIIMLLNKLGKNNKNNVIV